MTVLLLALAAVCFAVSATRRISSVPWLDIGLVLLTVAFIFAASFPGVAIDGD